MTSLPPARLYAARRLAIDAATAEVVTALRAAGIRSVLLKGPAIAARLYDDPLERGYGDFDLLVEATSHPEAIAVVRQLGFADVWAGVRASERSRHSSTWTRPGSTLDLHHTLNLARCHPAAAWRYLSAGTRTLTVAGTEVEVLGDPALALVISAHRVQHGPLAKTDEDLRRAMERFTPEIWSQACELAASLKMVGALAGGLRTAPTGEALAARFGLPEVGSAEIELGLSGARAPADGLRRLAESGWAWATLRLLAEELVPSPAFMRSAYPVAGGGAAGLALSYLYRSLLLVWNLPHAADQWRTVQRGVSPRRRRYVVAKVRVAVWAWRAATRVRRQLRDGGLDAMQVPSPPVVGTQAEGGMRRVLRRRRLSCLEHSLVRQRWHAAHGSDRELVIGVSGPGEAFGAHAWLDGDPVSQNHGFQEIVRLPARR